MAQTRFWNLRSPDSTAKCAEWAHDEMHTEKVICPLYDGHQHGGKRLTDLSITLPGRNVEDFVWTWYSECLLQDRVLDLFKAHGFTGFDVKPVKARFERASEHEPPTLWELVITGWGGLARPESGVRRVEYCQACQHVTYSGITDAQKLIDESQWDGSDFFMVWPMPLFLFVTDRVADCIRDHRLSGAVLKRVDELGQVGKNGLGGGRLSYWMPESRARELGTAAGIAEI